MARIWGRSRTNSNLPGPWVKVETLPNGDNSYVYITALAQCLLLNLNESPFYGNWGLPAHPSVVQQLFPTLYVSLTQQRFAPFFASLTITAQQLPTPVYQVNLTTSQGTPFQMVVI
jgi:hypothetical protein